MRQLIINKLLKNVVKVSRPNDVIRSDKGVLYVGSAVITKQEIKTLQSEAKALKGMRLWSILNETLKQKIYEKGWVNSTSIEHLNIAKAEFAVLDTQESIIKIISNITT